MLCLIAVHRSVSCRKRRCDPGLTCECVWIQIPIPNGFNLLVSTHCFPPNTDTKVIENYFNCLETKLRTQMFPVATGSVAFSALTHITVMSLT
jgi:hypothetical protein